jgi:hypothetical protein
VGRLSTNSKRFLGKSISKVSEIFFGVTILVTREGLISKGICINPVRRIGDKDLEGSIGEFLKFFEGIA